jgi:tRNA pseudouridine13 synthase
MVDDRLFSFKQKSQDFIVTEELPFTLAGRGDAFFVFFEKRNLNTMDIVHHLCAAFNLSRLSLGIAGLKDKKAITRQRICIYKSALKKLGGEKAFLESIGEVAKVLKTGRHTTPIGMTTPIQNSFYIRLRANKKLSEKEKDISNRKILSLCKK